jgi:hypothetical protein
MFISIFAAIIIAATINHQHCHRHHNHSPARAHRRERQPQLQLRPKFQNPLRCTDCQISKPVEIMK